MAQPATHTGDNRTGIQNARGDTEALLQTVSKAPAHAGETLKLASFREQFMKQTDGLGSVPPPASMKGKAKTTVQKMKGNKPAVFLDKLGERLAFERAGVRIYEGLLGKCEALGTWEGGPSEQLLTEQRDDELRHFNLLKEAIEGLGGDPTAMTPSADLAAVEGMGPIKVIGDPRTTLPQALHAALVIEDADYEGWTLLCELAEDIGQKELAEQFREAQQTEELHQQRVRSWFSTSVSMDAKRDLGGQGTAA